MVLEAKLDRLADAFEEHGIDVWSNLRPGASDAELDRLSEELDITLPDQFRTLYRWRNGHIDPAAENVLVFRDNTFIGLEAIPDVRQWVVDVYGHPEDDPDVVPVGVDLTECVPIAEFMGAAYVVACGPQTVTERSQHPVLSAFHGVNPFYYSIESMVDTCIDWVEQPDYRHHYEVPHERAIWDRHNPGIFSLM